MDSGKDGVMTTYEPRPIDTSKVQLDDQLLQLTEQLAENAHDHWARRRMAEGWTFGPVRDDAARKHPNLVPYGELSEAEKEYDRDTAMQTLKAIIALGWRIERGSSRSITSRPGAGSQRQPSAGGRRASGCAIQTVEPKIRPPPRRVQKLGISSNQR